MKFNFRKIASVLASTVMLSSTVALAAAANYPAPFVQSGNADVAIVYGSTAAVTDLVAVGDINTDLQARLAAQAGVSGSTTSSSVTVSGGDFVQLDRPSSKLHLGDGVSDVFGRSITNTDMPSLLETVTFTSDGDNNDHEYQQKIVVENISLTQFDDSDYKQDSPTVGVRIASGAPILNYTLTFNDKPDFSDNLKNSDIVIMGKNYYVLDQANTTSPSLTLLDSASTQAFNEGETKSVSVGNATYDITVTDVTSDNKVKISVGGKTSSSLQIGSTYKIADGVYIGVKDVIYKSKDNAVSKAELSIGAGKLVLTSGQDIELNDDSITNLVATINNGTALLNGFTIQWKADGDQFVTQDSSLTLPGFGSLKLSLPGIVYPGNEEVNVANDGRNTIQLSIPIKDGDAELSLLTNNATQTNFSIIGKDSANILRTTNETTLNFDGDTDEQFVASWASGKDAESYLLYATGFKIDNGVNKTTIKQKVGSFEQEVQAGDTITLGNVVLTIGTIEKAAKQVAITASTGTDFHTLYSATGLKVYLPYNISGVVGGGTPAGALNLTANGINATSFNLIFTGEDKDGNIAAGGNITVVVGAQSDGKVEVTSATFTRGSAFDEIGSSDVLVGHSYSALGTEVNLDQGPDQETAKLIYHGAESYGQLVLTDVSASVSGGGSGGSSLGSISVSDSEVSSVSGKNLIVVGGSCVNSVAAKLLGSDSALCGSAWEQATGVGSGSFLIQTFSSPWASNKIATLVAGYNAPDTSNAAKALTTQSVDTMTGKKYTGSVSTSITASVA